MYLQPTSYAQSSNNVRTMPPPLSSTTITASNNNTIRLSHEHRSRLYQIIHELNEEQLRLFLTHHLQSISNTPVNNQFQHHARTQLIQQAYVLVDNNFSLDMEQTLYAIRQNRFTSDHHHHRQQQQQQQAQQIYRSHQQVQQVQQQQHQNYNASYNNQQQYYCAPQNVQYNIQSNYRYPATSNVSQPYIQIRPTPTATQAPNLHTQNTRPQQQQQQQQSPYFAPVLARPPYTQHTSAASNLPNNSSPATIIRYQTPILAPPPSSILRPSIPTTINIVHKTLPFYQPITCIYECYQVFRYDTYRKHYVSRNEFLLSVDVCNQLALSYDYDADLDIHKTTKCLIMRLVRTDQPPMSNGKYDDNLPPNLVVNINSQNVTNLPIPKPCPRQQMDLIRPGREIDVTSYCMFNPLLNNELTMTWSYKLDNTNLHIQYATAQYALHLFLVQHLTIDDLCEQIKNKSARFYREDLVKLLAKAIAIDKDLGLEVSDQKLKLKCPIDQRRLRLPIRATTCHHLQCFDLTNYIALNEKAGKWICPVCNKNAFFDDLQIDSYTESILNSIENDNLTEISIDSDLNWTPVTSSSTLITEHHPIISTIEDIILDDDQIDEKPYETIDSKGNIHLISSSSTNQPTDVILIDD